MKKCLHLLFALALVFSAACDDDDSTPQGPISYPVQDYTLGNVWTWKETPNKRLIVIRSREELAEYVAPSDYPPTDIDFTEHTLLMAAGTAPNIVFQVFKDLSLKDNILTFTVDIDMGAFSWPAIDNWRLACLVPAIPREQELQYDLYFKYGDDARVKVDLD